MSRYVPSRPDRRCPQAWAGGCPRPTGVGGAETAFRDPMENRMYIGIGTLILLIILAIIIF